MSTRSAIARPTPDGSYEGRYCHWDGYPTNRGKQVWATLKHFDFDVDKALTYALREDEPGYWSSYFAPGESRENSITGGEIDGYRTDNGESWVTPQNDWGTEWIYVLYPDRLEVISTYSGRKQSFLYTDPEPDWEAVEAMDDEEAVKD